MFEIFMTKWRLTLMLLTLPWEMTDWGFKVGSLHYHKTYGRFESSFGELSATRFQERLLDARLSRIRRKIKRDEELKTVRQIKKLL